MEEETKVNFLTKAINWVKTHIAITIGIVAAVVVVIILICVFAGGGPKGAVKGFISGMNNKNAAKVIDNIDFAGSAAWGYFDEDDFSEDDYDEFIESYEDIDKDEVKEQEDELETTLEDGFDSIDDTYKSYKLTIDEFKSSEKIAKDLYVVEAKISLVAEPEDEDYDEIDESDVATFVVYNNKIIYSDIFYLF